MILVLESIDEEPRKDIWDTKSKRRGILIRLSERANTTRTLKGS